MCFRFRPRQCGLGLGLGDACVLGVGDACGLGLWSLRCSAFAGSWFAVYALTFAHRHTHAHTGTHARTHTHTHTHTHTQVEPLPSNVALLRRSVEANNLSDFVTVPKPSVVKCLISVL